MYRNICYMVLVVLFPLSGYAQSDIDIDFDDNGVVDLQDLLALTEAFGSYDAKYDLHPDGVIDFKDLIIFAGAYNQGDTSEAAVPITEEVEEQEVFPRVEFFELLTANSRPNDLAIDPRGYIWFTEMGANAISRLEPRIDMILRFSLTSRVHNPTVLPSTARDTSGFQKLPPTALASWIPSPRISRSSQSRLRAAGL